MRRIICVPFLLAALTALSVLPVQDCLAYGPGDSWYYGHYRRGGPGVEYDYGTAPSGTYDYGGPSAPQGNARVTADNTVRAYPGFNSNVPDTSTAQFAPGYWWDPNDDYWDDWDDWDDEDDWWYYNGGPEYSTARAGDTVPEAGGSSSMAAAGCQGGGSSYITDGTALTKMDIC